jgi:hypothetical protein
MLSKKQAGVFHRLVPRQPTSKLEFFSLPRNGSASSGGVRSLGWDASALKE